MGFEKMMEEAIISDPRKYIDEKGLKFIARQYHIGKYIFDLLFEDRHGGKLLVELQDGTLDRNHTYKILDYYYEYKGAHPEEFIDLMVIANIIPPERKKRLTDLGIAFKEIQRSDFISEPPKSLEPIPSQPKLEEIKEPSPPQSKIKEPSDLIEGNVIVLKSYNLYKNQKILFTKALREYEPSVTTNFDRDFNDDKAQLRKNWFFMFWPNDWRITHSQRTGVCYVFKYNYDKEKDAEFIKIQIAVQSPMKDEYKEQFKTEAVEALRDRKINLPECDLYPNAGRASTRPYLLQIKIPLNENTWKEAMEGYKQLKGFNAVVAEKIAEFKRKGYTK